MRYLSALFALTLPATAIAQTALDDETRIMGRLIDSRCVDLHDTIGCEMVILLASETEPDRADLMILTDRRSDKGAQPLLVVRDIAFNGAMWGMAPSLDATPNGSLVVHSEQTGIGRHAWNQTLTIAWRGGAFVVAGVTYGTWDRMTASTAVCDVNLLTGAWETRRTDQNEDGEVLRDATRSGRDMAQKVLLADWHADRALPAPCQSVLGAPD
jgi:hypothetical protein